jgi:hypothetical protein
VKISILVEGKTEKAFMLHLRTFLQARLRGQMPNLDAFPYDGRIPTGERLRGAVRGLLSRGPSPADAVIALTDVYTGTGEFADAADAKTKMRNWVGGTQNFYPHAAQYDFEAWLLPYWPKIQALAGTNRNPPSGQPESVNHNKPPSKYIMEAFRSGTSRNYYSKPRDANRILDGADLAIAASRCVELKAFLNTILTLSGGAVL